MERYYRMKELEEQENLRQRQAYTRMLRQQQQQEELEREAHIQQQQQEEENDLKPMYQLVQGPDGRIYRVVLDRDHDFRRIGSGRFAQTPMMPCDSNTISCSLTGAPNKGAPEKQGQSVPVKIQISTKSEQPTTTNSRSSPPVEEDNNCGNIVTTNTIPTAPGSSASSPSSPQKNSKKTKNKKRITVIVEDASDSETEDDTFHTVWRNRRPSPGQWMEPIENVNVDMVTE